CPHPTPPQYIGCPQGRRGVQKIPRPFLTPVPGGTRLAGIGKCVAVDLARRNARTVLACRDPAKGQAALDEIRRAAGNPNVHLRLLDLSSMASVRDFARRFLAEEPRLDILVNNAGITGLPGAASVEEVKLLFATNVLGPFLLTNLLLGTLKASAPARIVNVSSFVHYKGTVNVKFLTGEEPPKNCSQAYYSSKLMNVAFANELAGQLQGTGVTVNSLNPGVVRTGIMRHFSWAVRLLYNVCSIFMKSAEEGAVSTLYCAVSREVEGITGKYFDSDCSLVLPSACAQDPGVTRKLWDALEQLVDLRNGGTE
ncbi:retinol dehydrogenase 12-like, partial [Sphaerodactylus townsendi]|uniref:retinol dehydrogenase 12-like n=1 Tax=Sphaerodactylus townsendi TaxID=933632 RepID=UPI002026179B